MKLSALRTDALRHLASGDFARALRLYSHLIRRVPLDVEARMRVGDICVQVARPDGAKMVYAAVAYLDMQGGRPLHALVAIQALSDLGEDVAPLRTALGQIYGAGSPRVARVGGRLSPPSPDSEIEPPPVETAAPDPSIALQQAVEAAADTRTVSGFPEKFQPVPLLSDLSDRAFARLLGGAQVLRLSHGHRVLRQGDPGDAFYLVASGQVRVVARTGTDEPVELARLHEGAIFGEMALIRAEPRSASVEVVGQADLIGFGRHALQAAAEELPAVAAALDRFTRDRLLKNVLSTSPVFKPFSHEDRLELLKRFTGHEVAEGTEILTKGDEGRGLYVVLAGEMEVLAGEAPFEQVVARLQPGACFGVSSLISGRPTSASVRAARAGSVLFLAREYFVSLVAAVPEMRAFFEALSDEHAKMAQAALLSSGFSDDEDPLLF